MGTIHKFTLDLYSGNQLHVAMPAGAVVLSVQARDEKPTLWAMVDPWQPPVQRTFALVGTGQPMPSGKATFLGTVQLEQWLVLHVFEVTP